jgi:urease accessory protein UreF
MDQALEASAGRAMQDAMSASPLLDLAQGAQDRLYSRLFQS